MFGLGVITLSLVVVAWAILLTLGATRSASITELDKSIQNKNADLAAPALVQAETTYTALDTVINHMNKLRGQRFLFLPVWTAIKASVPKDVQFTNVTMADDNTFRVSGVAKSITSVAYFSNALMTNKDIVSEVTPHSVDKQNGGDGYSFSLSFKVAVPKTTASPKPGATP